MIKLVGDQNSYQSNTGNNGIFSFTDINCGNYQLIAISSTNVGSVTDSVNFYSTDISDWGDIYADLFASINGTIQIEGLSDYSFVNVNI